MRALLAQLLLAGLLNAQGPVQPGLLGLGAGAGVGLGVGGGVADASLGSASLEQSSGRQGGITPYQEDFDINSLEPSYVSDNDDAFWYNGGKKIDDKKKPKRPKKKDPKRKKCPKWCEPRYWGDHEKGYGGGSDDERDWGRDWDDSEDEGGRGSRGGGRGRVGDWDDNEREGPRGRSALSRRSPQGMGGFDWDGGEDRRGGRGRGDRDDSDDDDDDDRRGGRGGRGGRDESDDSDREGWGHKDKYMKCPKHCKPKRPHRPWKPWKPHKPHKPWKPVWETKWVTDTKVHTATRYVDPPRSSGLPAEPSSRPGPWPRQCPRPCDPNPLYNRCDSSTSCVIIKGKGQCLCAAGSRASGIPPWSNSQYRVTDPNSLAFVRVDEGLKCDTPCRDSLCTEVPVRDFCL